MSVTHLHSQSSCSVAHFDADGRPTPCPDPIRPPATDEEPWMAAMRSGDRSVIPQYHRRGCPQHVHPSQREAHVIAICTCGGLEDRANRERARYLALTCFALLAILAIVLWWTQR